MATPITRAVLVAAITCSVACDPIAMRGIALSPSVATSKDSLALGVASDVASEYRMAPSGTAGARWIYCYGGGDLSLCSQRVENEVQFVLMRRGFKWTPYADSVRTALLGALRNSFGESVRECEWTYIGPGDVYGCKPLVLGDSLQTR